MYIGKPLLLAGVLLLFYFYFVDVFVLDISKTGPVKIFTPKIEGFYPLNFETK